MASLINEGAYYEFRCIRAEIAVHYCAEQFPLDNAPMSAVFKSLKRAMAGEYSRELSAKVFAGQCRLITLGYRQGGMPGYGLRRLLLDQHGQPKTTLPRGERKSFQLERVILTPGPPEEVATVQRVYQLFTTDHSSETQIANILNNEGIRTSTGTPWTRATIRELLTNEKYIGNNVYNRTSTKLQKPRSKNKPEDWVRCNGAYTPIIDPALFETTQQLIRERDRHYTDDELLQLLRNLFQQHGMLSGVIIDETDGMPSAATYRHRFHSLRRAYTLVGYTPQRDYTYLAINETLRALHHEHLTTITTQFTSVGASVQHDPTTHLLRINNEFTASLLLARCRPHGDGDYRWILRFETSLDPDITIAARMAPGNTTILDYYLLPSIDIISQRCRLAPENGIVLDVYRVPDLARLFAISRLTTVPEAA
jgi:hypothetical protein